MVDTASSSVTVVELASVARAIAISTVDVRGAIFSDARKEDVAVPSSETAIGVADTNSSETGRVEDVSFAAEVGGKRIEDGVSDSDSGGGSSNPRHVAQVSGSSPWLIVNTI